MPMRLFVALELDETTRAALVEAIARLREHSPKIKWVRPEQLHVTVRFLGDVVEDELRPVCAAVDAAAAQAAPFVLEVAGLGCFPDLRRPRVLWAGAAGGADAAAELHDALKAELAPLGFDPDRRAYRPHVTLGRIKAPGHARNLEPLLPGEASTRFGAVDTDHLTVFLSELKRGGARYSPIHRAPLGAG
ncbi:MAG: RNA 2',3'-cyclic phosphodiesterase [Planctomycetota bacterium]